jgi:hypothetical protein
VVVAVLVDHLEQQPHQVQEVLVDVMVAVAVELVII